MATLHCVPQDRLWRPSAGAELPSVGGNKKPPDRLRIELAMRPVTPVWLRRFVDGSFGTQRHHLAEESTVASCGSICSMMGKNELARGSLENLAQQRAQVRGAPTGLRRETKPNCRKGQTTITTVLTFSINIVISLHFLTPSVVWRNVE